jgi:hypothetical protein
MKPGCGCELCVRPLLEPAMTQAEALRRNRAYEEHRRRLRTDRPPITRDQLVVLEMEHGR